MSPEQKIYSFTTKMYFLNFLQLEANLENAGGRFSIGSLPDLSFESRSSVYCKLHDKLPFAESRRRTADCE